MSTLDPAAIIDGIRSDTEAINGAAAEAQAARDAAAARLEEAEQIARGATLRADRGPGGTSIREAMSAIGGEIDTARVAAVDAIRNGSDPVAAWVAYRLEGARLLGIWKDIANAFVETADRRPPPGPGHRLPPLPTPGPGPDAHNAEGFEAFLTHTVRQLEEQAHRDSHDATREARLARDAAQP